MARNRGRRSLRVTYSPLTKVLCMCREKERLRLFFKASSLDAQKERQTDTHLCLLIHPGSAAIWQPAPRAIWAASSSQLLRQNAVKFLFFMGGVQLEKRPTFPLLWWEVRVSDVSETTNSCCLAPSLPVVTTHRRDTRVKCLLFLQWDLLRHRQVKLQECMQWACIKSLYSLRA